MCLSFPVFVGCWEAYVGGIYSAKVQPNGTQLDFNKIVSPAHNPYGISHHDHTKQLVYTVGFDGIYKCDFTGANNEAVLTGLTSK